MTAILVPTASSGGVNKASHEIVNRSFLYDKDKNILYVKYNGQLNPIGGINDKSSSVHSTYSSSKINSTFATITKLNEVINEINTLESDIETIGSIQNTVYNNAADSILETIITPKEITINSDVDISSDLEELLYNLQLANISITADQITSCELLSSSDEGFSFNVKYNAISKVSIRDKLTKLESDIQNIVEYVSKIPILEPETEHIVY